MSQEILWEKCKRFKGYSHGAVNPGQQGSFTKCNASCEKGFVKIGECSGGQPNCYTMCGRDLALTGDCTPSEKPRSICERPLDDFKPIKEKNVREKCCNLPLTNMTARDANDCPYAFHQIELPDNKTDESDFCKLDLLPKCIDPSKPNAILDDECDILGVEGAPTLNDYNASMKKYCMSSLNNLNIDKCAKWCNNNELDCDRTRIGTWCRSLKSAEYKDKEKVCGCFLNPNIYTNIRNKIKNTYAIPDGYLNNKKCYFPDCDKAIIQESEDASCPTTSLTNCIKNIDIDTHGDKDIPVELEDTEICKTTFRNRICNPVCEGVDKECSEGLCVDDLCKKNGKNCNYTTQKCEAGECKNKSSGSDPGGGAPPGGAPPGGAPPDDDKPEDEKGSNTWLIVGIVGGIIMIIGIAALIFFMNKKK